MKSYLGLANWENFSRTHNWWDRPLSKSNKKPYVLIEFSTRKNLMTFSVSKITLYSIRNWAAFSVKGPNRISKIIQFQKRTLPDNTVALCFGLRVWTRLLSLDWDQPRWKNLVQKSGPTKAIKSFLLQPESPCQSRSSNETPFAFGLIVEFSFKIV